MSEEEVQLTGKAKKAKRSEERFKKGKKRKIEDVADPAQAETDPAPITENTTEQVDDSSSKVEPKAEATSKKRKNIDAIQGTTNAGADANATAETDGAGPRKRRKNKSANTTDTKTSTTDGATSTAKAEGAADADGAAAAETASKQRFIVFIGNLPFTATTEGITAHFASIAPTSVRHLTEPGSNKSKGYAFLEFANYDRMKTCLKLFHHSTFDSGVGGERGQRKINVELTAGGGGKGGQRKEKLKVKNERLEDQRKRRAEAEAKSETRKAKKGLGKNAGGKDSGEKKEQSTAPATAGVDTEGIHPARLAQMRKAGRG